MKSLRFVLLPFALASLAAAADPVAVSRQTTALEIDPARTTIEFNLGDTLHKVHGTFALKRGNLRFDAVTGAASGELVVDAASGDSGNSGRDRRMNKSVLESDRFPEIVFRPDRVDGKVVPDGVSHVQLHGLFTIHGTEHEMVLPVEVQASAGAYTVTTTFSVPYVKWGMKNPSLLLLRVSDHVEISIHTAARNVGQAS